MFGRTKIAMLVGEFLGAATLTLVVLSVANSRIGFPLFIAAAAGLTAGLLTLALGKTSGAHANPVVTAALWSLKKIPTPQALAYIVVQIVGGIGAFLLYQYLTGDVLDVKIAELSKNAGEEFSWTVFTAEAVGAFIFVFGLVAGMTQKLEEWTWAFVVGASLSIGIVVASVASNALINPAVAVGARSVSQAYIFGPLVGALAGANLYQRLFAPAPVSVATRVKAAAKKVTRRKK